MEFSKWKITDRSGKLKEGGNWWQQARIRTSMMIAGTGCFLEEGIILSNWNTDSQGNKSENTHKGYYYISLMRLNEQIYFAFKHKRGWRVLSDDALTYVKDFKTKKEAVADLIKKAHKIEEAKSYLK